VRSGRAKTVGALLAAATPSVREVAEAARQLVLAAVPGVEERVRPGWGLIGYDAPRYFAFVYPGAQEVRVGFEWGVALDDPSGLLEGAGTQVRWVTLRRLSDVCRPALRDLIRQAVDAHPRPRRGGQRERSKR
jgi:hypothetical protein